MFERILKYIEKNLMYFCVICLAAIAAIMFFEVFLRNIFGINLQWALEFSKLLMVWTCFMGASVVYREKGHIGIEALVRLLPIKIQSLVSLIVYLSICYGFGNLIFYASSLMIVQHSQEIVPLDIPRSALSLPIVMGISLMIVTSIYFILEEIRVLLKKKKNL